MKNKGVNNIKLGLFVLSGLLFLVVLLYMIGKNSNLFGKTYILKARFENVQGLVAGNNVRYAGIQAGTVKKISILSDTVLEVTMIIEKEMNTIIRSNAIASIGSEGLVGNKVVNIVASKVPSVLAEKGSILQSKKTVDTDAMLNILSKTNDDISLVANQLVTTVGHINNSRALWKLLSDTSIPMDLKKSVYNVRAATATTGNIANNLDALIRDVMNGKGLAGAVMKDTLLFDNLNNAARKIRIVSDKADSLILEANYLISAIRQEVNTGHGTINTLLKDSSMALSLKAGIKNIESGTEGFNQNMEALKHSFLFRGYFRKLAKKKNNTK